MPLTSHQIEKMFPEFMAYEPDLIEVDGVIVHDPHRMEATISIEGSVRDESEIFCEGDSDLDISFITGNSTSDNAPTDTLIRTGITLDKADMHDNPLFEGFAHDSLTIMISGYLSTPEYCDDESDGNFNGTVYVQAGDSDWAEEQSRTETIGKIEESITDMITTTTRQISMLRAIGKKGPVSKDALGALVRDCLKAA